MVKQINGLFQCDECHLLYKEKTICQKCESWCRANHSCNLEIIRFAVSK